MDVEKFSIICKKSQHELKEWLKEEITKEYIEGDGYLYFKGSTPVLLVAHLDTVHKRLPQKIIIEEDCICAKEGIGGDDRCGIYAILEILKTHDISVLFCEDEESGCIGAEKFVKTELCKKLYGSFKYIMEFDRQGYEDAVYYDCDNRELKEFISSTEYWTEKEGIYSDVLVLGPALGSAYVNLSCGYFNQHTKEEYVIPSVIDRCIREAVKLLNKTNEYKYFTYQERSICEYDKWCTFWENYNI